MDRYARQTILPDFGLEGQKKLRASKILVVGLGGLGLPVVQYLNAMGVGTLGLVEQDIVEYHNLQRQVLYTESDIGKPKSEVALSKLKLQNSETSLIVHDTFMTKENALAILSGYDVVVDATDNFPTRYLINDACVILKKPLVSGALQGFEGQISVFNFQGGPTYRCLYPKMPSKNEVPNCSENGVLGIIPGIIGSLQALETVKVVTGIGEVLRGKLLIFNGLTQQYVKIDFKANPKNWKREQLEDDYGNLECETVPAIQADVFFKRYTDEECIVIDVRTNREFEESHLNKALNIPLDMLELPNHLQNFSEPMYIICQSGKRSEQAVLILQERYPLSKFYTVEGGMNQLSLLTH